MFIGVNRKSPPGLPVGLMHTISSQASEPSISNSVPKNGE
jgi:hypothetical protein